MAVKRAIPGVVLLPLPFISDSPLCPVTAVTKRVIPGVVSSSPAIYTRLPPCPVTAVKRVIPGVVLFPLPFIPDSPQFALLQQLKGLSALYLSGVAWLPGFRLSSRFSPHAFLLSLVFEKGWVLFSLPLGPRPKIMLATSSVGESAPLPFIPGFLSNLLKCLGTGIRMLCYFTLRSLLPLDCNPLIPLLNLSSLQTFLLHNLLNLGVTCFVLILYIYWVITYFTFFNKGCHSSNLAWVVDRTNRNTLCPYVILRCALRMCSEFGLLAMLTDANGLYAAYDPSTALKVP